MSGLRSWLRAGLLPMVVFSMALTTHLDAAASGPDLVNARLQGAWNLEVTVASYSGPQKPSNRPVGHKATDQIWFDSTCPAPGSCAVRIWGQTGPDPSQAAFYTYYSNASGFQGTVGTTLLQQAGSTYSVAIPIGGFGGFTCSPPSGTTRPAQSLKLQVVEAKHNGACLLYTSPSPRDRQKSRMPSSA